MSEELPETGEVVVCRVNRVLNYGVFVDLLEYGDAKGFVHVSQVASRWVKNIRNYVKENQLRAAKVLYIDSQKNQIDLSLVKVSPREQRKKIEEYKQFKRAQKLVEVLAKNAKKPFDSVWEGIAEPLIHEFGSLHAGFQEIALRKGEAAKGISPEWQKPLVELVSKSISVPKKTVKGTLVLSSTAPDGVEAIKKALNEAKKAAKGKETEIYYEGSSNYVLKVSSHDFKSAEKQLKELGEKALESIKASGGTGEFKTK